MTTDNTLDFTAGTDTIALIRNQARQIERLRAALEYIAKAHRAGGWTIDREEMIQTAQAALKEST